MKKYTIKKGRHYSGYRFRPILFPRSVSFEFMFTEESKYQSEPHTKLREQWLKLAGIALDPFGRNSARVAWRYNSDTDTFEMCQYLHLNGSFKVLHHTIRTIPINTRTDILLYNYFGLIGYRQFPHFGGKAAAPNDVSIHLKFI